MMHDFILMAPDPSVLIYPMSVKVVHRFLRQPNINSSIYNRVADRHDPFANTLTLLEDPKTNRSLYLIGTTNASTTLAYRTRKLIQEVNPTSLYVQANQNWWDHARHISVNNQAEFSRAISGLSSQPYKFENNLRGILWRLRYYSWVIAMKNALGFPEDFDPFTPGLETKFAIEEAVKLGVKPIFGGEEFDPITMEGLRLETDMYAHVALWRARLFYRSQNAWGSDASDFFNTLKTRGGEAFAESIDRSRANLGVQLFNKLAPIQKRVVVDVRDERIFRDLYKESKGERIVAVVNQWHMQGIETHWRRATGTEDVEVARSPVEDMNIDAYQEQHVINEFLRERASKLTRSEPATHQDMLTSYHKENYEYERTRHTHHDSHEDIPNPGEESKHSHH